MPKIFYTEDEYESLKFEKKNLEKELTTLKAMRPQWAQGFTSDSVADQTSSNALYTLWAKLKVSNQTDAVHILDLMIKDLVRLSPLTRQ